LGIEHEALSIVPSVVINARGEQRVRGGHPWIYRADVVDVDADGGDIVQVIGPRKRTIGQALFSDRSQIPIRMLTLGDEPAGETLLRSRLQRAIEYRASLQLDATAYRLVHGEADLLPSLGDRSVRRLSRRAGALAGHGSTAADDHRGAAGHARARRAFWRATIRRCVRSKGSSRRFRIWLARSPTR
jgi:23S rRNA (cytosine1962-C5)-methyltransferase